MGNQSSKLAAQDVIFVGLDNSGKSTLIKQLLGEEQLAQTAPTLGCESFSYYHPQHRGCKTQMRHFNMIDLGGHERIRGIWHNYYATSLGIVFVFDASDVGRYKEMVSVCNEVLRSNFSKHILICGNKQDLRCRIKSQEEFEDVFQVKLPANMHFEATVGTDPQGRAKDALTWLLDRLSAADTKEVDAAKEELKNKRKYAGLTTEQKMSKLAQIKRENDEYDAVQRAKKPAEVRTAEATTKQVLKSAIEI